MHSDLQLPPDLIVALDGERPERVVRAGRAYTGKSIALGFGVAAVLITMGSFFLDLVWGELYRHGEAYIEINDRPYVVTWDDLAPAVIPTLVAGILVLGGIALLINSVAGYLRKGGWFAFTPTRLIHMTRNKTRSIFWRDLEEDIRRTGDIDHGTLSLSKRTPANEREGNVARLVQIIHVPDPVGVERLIRRHIENDATTGPVADGGQKGEEDV